MAVLLSATLSLSAPHASAATIDGLDFTFDSSTEVLSWELPEGISESQVVEYRMELYWPARVSNQRESYYSTSKAVYTEGWDYKGLFLCVRVILTSREGVCSWYQSLGVPLLANKEGGQWGVSLTGGYFQFNNESLTLEYNPFSLKHGLIDRVEITVYEAEKIREKRVPNWQCDSMRYGFSGTSPSQTNVSVSEITQECTKDLAPVVAQTTLRLPEFSWKIPDLPEKRLVARTFRIEDFSFMVRVFGVDGSWQEYKWLGMVKIPRMIPEVRTQVWSSAFASRSDGRHQMAIYPGSKESNYFALLTHLPKRERLRFMRNIAPLKVEILTPEICSVSASNYMWTHISPRSIGECKLTFELEQTSLFEAVPLQEVTIDVVKGSQAVCTNGSRSFNLVVNKKDQPRCNPPYRRK